MEIGALSVFLGTEGQSVNSDGQSGNMTCECVGVSCDDCYGSGWDISNWR